MDIIANKLGLKFYTPPSQVMLVIPIGAKERSRRRTLKRKTIKMWILTSMLKASTKTMMFADRILLEIGGDYGISFCLFSLLEVYRLQFMIEVSSVRKDLALFGNHTQCRPSMEG